MKLLTREEYNNYFRFNEVLTCFFCEPESQQLVIEENEHWYLAFALAPYWKWHTLLVPKKHLESITELSQAELVSLEDLKKKTLKIYKEEVVLYQKDIPLNMFMFFWREREQAFDFLENVPKFEHLHIHIVPERDGHINPIMDPHATEFPYAEFLDKHLNKEQILHI